MDGLVCRVISNNRVSVFYRKFSKKLLLEWMKVWSKKNVNCYATNYGWLGIRLMVMTLGMKINRFGTKIYVMSDPVIIGDKLYTVDHFSVDEAYRADLLGIMIPYGMINSRVERLREVLEGHCITSGYDRLLDMTVMKGAKQFSSDLFKGFGLPYEEEFIWSRRYGDLGSISDQRPEILISNPSAIEGSDVLVVEDIVDEGPTAERINEEVRIYKPRSVSFIVLLDKVSRRLPEINLEELFDFVLRGFEIPDRFVVGYGLDYKEKYRGLRHLGVLKPEMYAWTINLFITNY